MLFWYLFFTKTLELFTERVYILLRDAEGIAMGNSNIQNVVVHSTVKFVQTPAVGSTITAYTGSTVTFSVRVTEGLSERSIKQNRLSVYLRTTIKCLDVYHSEQNKHQRYWSDYLLNKISDEFYSITLPILYSGSYEAKCYIIDSVNPDEMVWEPGSNSIVIAKPAITAGLKSIYSVSPRQFHKQNSAQKDKIQDKNQDKHRRQEDKLEIQKTVQELESQDYTVIYPSGKFRDLLTHIDFIINKLKFRYVLLLPVFPSPTTYGRMGVYGSHYATLDFNTVDNAYAEFDVCASPAEQFKELIDEIHNLGGSVLLDIPANHTGWASFIQNVHPEWLEREGRAFKSPGAWGIVWADLVEIQYHNDPLHTKQLIDYIASIFLYWSNFGIDGFRCDAGYKVPREVWVEVIDRVRDVNENAIFFLEGLGGPMDTIRELTIHAGMDWNYSELFQNYSKQEIEGYLHYCTSLENSLGGMIHFAETHDNNRLASVSADYARMRLQLSALLSYDSGWGFNCGVEWLATVKYDVHDVRSTNWGATPNLVKEINRLNTILARYNVFWTNRVGASEKVDIRFIQNDNGNVIIANRVHSNVSVLVIINLSSERNTANWQTSNTKFDYSVKLYNILDDDYKHSVMLHNGGTNASCELAPYEVVCLVSSADYSYEFIEHAREQEPEDLLAIGAGSRNQTLKFVALKILSKFGIIEKRLSENNETLDAFISEFVSSLTVDISFSIANLLSSPVPPVRKIKIDPQLGVDNKLFMCSSGDIVVLESRERFSCVFKNELGQVVYVDKSIIFANGNDNKIIFVPSDSDEFKRYTIEISCFVRDVDESDGHYTKRRMHFHKASLLVTPAYKNFEIPLSATSSKQKNLLELYGIATSEAGGYAKVNGAFNVYKSKYDAMFAGNCDNEYPVDRHVLLSRLLGWCIHKGYTVEINSLVQIDFMANSDNEFCWCFEVPVLYGKYVLINIIEVFDKVSNQAAFFVERVNVREAIRKALGKREERYIINRTVTDYLDDSEPITVVVRPDIEGRVNHSTSTIEHINWVAGIIQNNKYGFYFDLPNGFHFSFVCNDECYHPSYEQHTGIYLSDDVERGMYDGTNFLSPGYFSFELSKIDNVKTFSALCLDNKTQPRPLHNLADVTLSHTGNVKDVMKESLKRFVVRRGIGKTIIAGYPWFLDWGRDTFIVLRGLIEAKEFDTVKDIVLLFGEYEENGTLPNIIHGSTASNRDTVDAQLWYIIVVEEYINVSKDKAILKADCGNRKLSDVVLSIVEHYISGTPNGIKMNADTGFIFSPAHFTWMDTNYPSGTPRKGYPIEIQALWCRALRFIVESGIVGKSLTKEPSASAKATLSAKDYGLLSVKVKENIKSLFYNDEISCFSDCLHADDYHSKFVADDHVRPNQIFLVTLGVLDLKDEDENKLAVDIINSCSQLIIPGNIRSLANKHVSYGLAITHNGHQLNNSHEPYWGYYTGDEDTRRKPAYHNGTGWSWVFGSYIEGVVLVNKANDDNINYNGKNYGADSALSLLMSCFYKPYRGALGFIEEICDGDYPHNKKGCIAQAWGVSEFLRVYLKYSNNK